MEIIDRVLKFIDIGFIVSINICAYMIIWLLNVLIKPELHTAWKRIITVIVGVVITYGYMKFELITLSVAIPSFFLSIIMYDYVIKNVLRRFKVTNSTDDTIKTIANDIKNGN